MNIFKPSTWFKKDSDPHCYAHVNPGSPHAGLDHFSNSAVWPISFRIDGIEEREARRELCGKVPDWDRIKAKNPELKKLRFTVDELKASLR